MSFSQPSMANFGPPRLATASGHRPLLPPSTISPHFLQNLQQLGNMFNMANNVPPPPPPHSHFSCDIIFLTEVPPQPLTLTLPFNISAPFIFAHTLKYYLIEFRIAAWVHLEQDGHADDVLFEVCPLISLISIAPIPIDLLSLTLDIRSVEGRVR